MADDRPSLGVSVTNVERTDTGATIHATLERYDPDLLAAWARAQCAEVGSPGDAIITITSAAADNLAVKIAYDNTPEIERQAAEAQRRADAQADQAERAELVRRHEIDQSLRTLAISAAESNGDKARATRLRVEAKCADILMGLRQRQATDEDIEAAEAHIAILTDALEKSPEK